jgi:hypothetical protein
MASALGCTPDSAMGFGIANDGGGSADAGRAELSTGLVQVDHTSERGIETSVVLIDKRLVYGPIIVLLVLSVLALAVAWTVRRK